MAFPWIFAFWLGPGLFWSRSGLRAGRLGRCGPLPLDFCFQPFGLSRPQGLCPISPAGSVGAERCPPGTSAPRRGVLRASGTRPGPTGAEAETLTENSPLDYFPIFLRLPKATKVVGRCPTPCQLSFEKAGQRTSSASAPAALRRRSQRNHRRGRALTSRSSASVSSPPQGANRLGCNPRGRALTSRSSASVSSPLHGANCSVRARTLVARSPHRADRAKVLFVVLVLPN